jgi:O-antigen ligase
MVETKTAEIPAAPLFESRDLLNATIFVVALIFVASCFFSIAVNSLSLGLLAILWLVSMIRHRQWTVVATPLDWYFLAYCCAEATSTILSQNPAQSFELSKRLLLIGIVYFFASQLRTDRAAKVVIATAIGAVTLMSIIGIGKLLFAPAEDTVRLGVFTFYMTTSERLMIGVLIITPFLVHATTPWRIRLVAAAALLPVSIALYATVTKGAYLAAAAGLLVIAITRSRYLVILLLLLAIGLFMFGSDFVQSRIMSIVDLNHPENQTRIYLWKGALNIFKHFPLFGVGDIDLHEVLARYGETPNPEQLGHLHNNALQFLVTLGSVGFIVVTALFVKIALMEWRVFRSVRDDWFRSSVALGALAVFIGVQVMGLSEWSFGDQEVATLLWWTVGMTLAVGRLAASPAALKGGR